MASTGRASITASLCCFALVNAVASQEFLYSSIGDVDEALGFELRNNSTAKTPHGPVHHGPYWPSGIVDPFSDINCQDLKCSASDVCKDAPYRLCQPYANCKTKVCLHKNLYPMLPNDLLLFVVMFVIAVCAGAAGIGGGGLNVPILMMINAFGIKEAVPLSHAAVMGNSLAQLLFNCKQRHPSTPHRPLIHYELAILALPAQLGGSSLGVVIGRVFPPSLLIILSLVMLFLASSKTLVKGIEVFKDYRKKHTPQSRGANADHVSLQSPLSSDARTVQALPRGPSSPSPPHSPAPSSTRNISQDLGLPIVAAADPGEIVRTWSGTKLMLSAARSTRNQEFALAPASSSEHVPMRIPWPVVWTMIGFNVVFCLDFLAMSPDVFHVEKCSISYWLALLGLYPFVIGSIWIGIRSLTQLKLYHESRGDPSVAGDPEVSMRLIILFPLAAAIIGLISGLVGLGGGEFMVPLLLEFGLLPRVASATSGFLILFATSSNIVHYLVANIMQPFIQYGVKMFIVAFLGAACGLSIRDSKYMREHSYLLVFMLAALLIVSSGLLAYRGFVMSKLDWGFKEFCLA